MWRRSQGDSASPQKWDDDDARVSWSRQHTLSTSAMTDLQAAFVINQPYWHFTWMELVISILISLEPAMSTHHIEFMSASSWSPLQAIVLDASFNWVLSSWTFQVCISHAPTFGGAKTDLSHVKACFEIQLGLLIGLLASALCLEMLCSRKMMVMPSFLFDAGFDGDAVFSFRWWCMQWWAQHKDWPPLKGVSRGIKTWFCFTPIGLKGKVIGLGSTQETLSDVMFGGGVTFSADLNFSGLCFG